MFSAAENFSQHAVSCDKHHLKMLIYNLSKQFALLTGHCRFKQYLIIHHK